MQCQLHVLVDRTWTSFKTRAGVGINDRTEVASGSGQKVLEGTTDD
jgi:hypothetical protein